LARREPVGSILGVLIFFEDIIILPELELLGAGIFLEAIEGSINYGYAVIGL